MPEASPRIFSPNQHVASMYALATRAPRDFGTEVARSKPLTSRVILHAKPPKGRKHRNRQGVPARNSNSRQNAKPESEPWLLVASPSLALSARQLITIYGRRMQIELSLRDLKSHRHGQGFENSLTRKGARIEVLLLLSAMAAFASWLVGMGCERCGIDEWFATFRSKRRLNSVMRRAREALVRRWSSTRLNELIDQLRHPVLNCSIN